MSRIEGNPENESELQERRRIKGAYQVWVEQLQRVNRCYARIEKTPTNITESDFYTDDVYSFFVQCYHLIEWIERDPEYCSCERNKRCSKDSCPERWVEDHRSLNISRDLCIRVKHVELSNDRTGKARFATQTDARPGFPFNQDSPSIMRLKSSGRTRRRSSRNGVSSNNPSPTLSAGSLRIKGTNRVITSVVTSRSVGWRHMRRDAVKTRWKWPV